MQDTLSKHKANKVKINIEFSQSHLQDCPRAASSTHVPNFGMSAQESNVNSRINVS